MSVSVLSVSAASGSGSGSGSASGGVNAFDDGSEGEIAVARGRIGASNGEMQDETLPRWASVALR